jgi:hypothetical protein
MDFWRPSQYFETNSFLPKDAALDSLQEYVKLILGS